MLYKKWISSFVKNKMHFTGAYSLSTEKSEYCFLLSKAGCSMLIHNKLISCLISENIDENFAMKLMAHGMLSIDGVTHWNHCDNIVCLDKPDYFIIDLTKTCNLNCIYCFRNLNDYKTISDDVLTDICNYIDRTACRLNLNSIKIQLWGGEPLTVMNKIRMVTDFFKSKKYRTGFDIETNATLITDSIAKELHERNISVGVSIDGTPELQNIQRPKISGSESYFDVKKGIDSLRKIYGTKFGAICVITKKNYKKLNEIIGYFVNDLGIYSAKFNPVRDNVNAVQSGLGLNEQETQLFAKQLCDILDTYKALGIGFSESNIHTRQENLLCRSNSNCCISSGCSAGKRIISFDMDGNIFPCEMMDYPEYKLGSIYSDTGFIALTESKQKNAFKKRKCEKCSDCPWWYFCKGGCNSRVNYIGRPDDIDKTECILNKTIYPYLVEKMLNSEKLG